MVVMYTLPGGARVGSHYLAIGVLSTMFAGTYLLSGGSKAKAQQGPPINAGSKEEGDFIQQFLKDAEGDSAKREGSAKH